MSKFDEDYVAAALSCVDTPVVYMGRNPGKGLDCAGVAWASSNIAGNTLPPTRSYSQQPTADELYAVLSEHCDPLEFGDLDRCHVLQVYVGDAPRHVVVPVGSGRVVEAVGWDARRKVRVVPLVWRPYGFWRFRGVA